MRITDNGIRLLTGNLVFYSVNEGPVITDNAGKCWKIIMNPISSGSTFPVMASCTTGDTISKFVFVSSATDYTGNLGGLAGADAKCQARADAAGLTGTYKAWLSSSTVSASSRLTHNTGPYMLLKQGYIIANNWSDLIDGTLARPINVTETGTEASSNIIWTNTTTAGEIKSASATCSDWTSISGYVQVGQAATSSIWTDYASGQCNSTGFSLYCIEQ